MTASDRLYNTVIKNDYCIGCGVCACMEGSPFKIEMDRFGKFVAVPVSDMSTSNAAVAKVCPFSEDSKNENELAKAFFPALDNENEKIGKYIACYAGFVKEGQFRENGSSGGFGKWIGAKLLKEKEIDCYIHVVPNKSNEPGSPLFDYEKVLHESDVIKGSKSAYYPVTLVSAISTIRKTPGKFAITGVPCFIKAIRLLSLIDSDIRQKVKYTIGLVCGGMKSANHAKATGWQLGVQPDNILSVDFRRKYTDKPAWKKGYQVFSNLDQKIRFKDSSSIIGTDWIGSFRPNVCDYCDDVVSEVADISIGDAWLPEFALDPAGSSIIIVRNAKINELLLNSDKNNAIKLNRVTPEDVIKSQEGGFRYRHEALSYRLSRKEKSGLWYPQKRIKPGQFQLSRRRKHIYRLREAIAAKSHLFFLDALEKNDLDMFKNRMKPLYRRHRILTVGVLVYISGIAKKFISKIF